MLKSFSSKLLIFFSEIHDQNGILSYLYTLKCFFWKCTQQKYLKDPLQINTTFQKYEL